LHDVGWFCLSPPSVAGCQGVVCVPAANLQGCGGLSMSPMGNYALQAVWQACGAFLWLCQVPASTLMLMGDRLFGMVSAVGIGGGNFVFCWLFLYILQRGNISAVSMGNGTLI